MDKATQAIKTSQMKAEEDKEVKNKSFLLSMVNDYLVEPSWMTALTYINLIVVNLVILFVLMGFHVSFWIILIYAPIIYFVNSLRKAKKEKDRLQIAHRIPFFAEALANALSVGSTLEQAFIQASFFLKGKIKKEFDILILKNSLGKNLGELLRELDAKFPNTGLVYLISLLSAYNDLGVGISPLLKRISHVLEEREKAEDKIRMILAGGNTYAKLTIGIFSFIFLGLSYLLQDELSMLLSPKLKPIFIFLCLWTSTGILVVTRMSSFDFTRSFALRPYIMKFMSKRKLSFEECLKYSGHEWTQLEIRLLYAASAVFGLVVGYSFALYTDSYIIILIGFLLGAYACWRTITLTLTGLVEEQLVKIVELFPEILQIFIIGLNSGLNTYLAFLFAQNAVNEGSPKLLLEELCRTKFAMECGEDHSKTWQRLAEKLPFETTIDFCEIMVTAPMHGESIVHAIAQMIQNYQIKKLTLIEKKATTLSQLVIPVIIMAFFPLFLFFMFAPLISKISGLILS